MKLWLHGTLLSTSVSTTTHLVDSCHALSFLSSLSNCSQLDTLYIYHNTFGGQLPDSVGNLSTRLRMLYMGRNQISGSIPEGIGRLVGLSFLDMEVNFLTGTIPDSIGKLQKLGRLFFHRNNLYGEIPSSIGNLSQLFDLYLHSNNFEGSIPSTLWSCKNIQNLHLSENNFTGIIPEQALGLLESSIAVNISYNSLTGSLPSDIGNLKNLLALIVSENNMSGAIPTELGKCSGLALLLMEGNFFQESIPSSLSSLKSLQRLDLSRNNLSGTIPSELENLSLLTSLNLSFNHLEGEVPTGGVFSNASAFSVLGNKALCGGIPEVQLPPCFNQGNRLSAGVIVAIVVSILVTTTSIAVLVILYRRRKPDSASPLGETFLKVSYKELLQATDGFASSNLIGVGNFGSVYKAFLWQDEKPVAVKVLHLQKHGASKSFVSECKALSRIRHRNLLKIITACSSVDYNGDDFKALVFELMANGSVENWLQADDEEHGARNLNFGQRLDIAIDVACALDYLHHHCNSLIVHCDLKPSNVLLDEEMVAHVGDFGLAKLLSSDTGNFSRDQTNSAAIKGTIGYVAPEYGMGGTVSPLGDIYSYGILLLELLTGKRPTDIIFRDGLSLRNFTKMALPERVREIVDSRLLGQYLGNQADKEAIILLDCLGSFARIGVACSAEFPGERMDVKDVIKELHLIKGKLHASS